MDKIRPWWGRERSLNLAHADALLRQAVSLERHLFEAVGPLDRAVADYRSARPRMGSNDRALLSTAIYGLARNREALRSVLPDGTPGSGEFLTLALYDSLADGRVLAPPSVLPALKALDEERLRLIAVIEADQDAPPVSSPALSALATLFSITPELVLSGPWETVGAAAQELNAARFPQSPQLRVLTSRLTREAAIEILRERGIASSPTGRSPWGLRLDKRLPTGALKGLAVEFQDEGSQLAALSCLPLDKGAKVLDYCAGAGGKGLALADAADCRVYLYDADSRRLAASLPRIRQSGATNVETLADPSLQAPYDLVLVDAPCSSTGTLRRNPEIGWHWRNAEIRSFGRTQAKLLAQASELVKPGGVLVYVTCSLLRPENEQVVAGFVSGRGDFVPEPPEAAGFTAVPGLASGAFRLPLDLPDYQGDGFFIARFRKKP